MEGLQNEQSVSFCSYLCQYFLAKLVWIRRDDNEDWAWGKTKTTKAEEGICIMNMMINMWKLLFTSITARITTIMNKVTNTQLIFWYFRSEFWERATIHQKLSGKNLISNGVLLLQWLLIVFSVRLCRFRAESFQNLNQWFADNLNEFKWIVDLYIIAHKIAFWTGPENWEFTCELSYRMPLKYVVKKNITRWSPRPVKCNLELSMLNQIIESNHLIQMKNSPHNTAHLYFKYSGPLDIFIRNYNTQWWGNQTK